MTPLGFLGGAGTEFERLENETDVPIWMKRVNCTGEEWRLQECNHLSATKDCKHDNDISIACICEYTETYGVTCSFFHCLHSLGVGVKWSILTL